MSAMIDEFICQARARLEARKADLGERLARVQLDLRRTTEPLPRDAPDAAIAVENDEVLSAIGEAARSELASIDGALRRIEQGTYGECESCAEDIGHERLLSVPYATRCAACARDA
jgi:RNA polymerase-binding transcription factor DksA